MVDFSSQLTSSPHSIAAETFFAEITHCLVFIIEGSLVQCCATPQKATSHQSGCKTQDLASPRPTTRVIRGPNLSLGTAIMSSFISHYSPAGDKGCHLLFNSLNCLSEELWLKENGKV